ncbi:SEL1-like repeat protein [soil metagenome]
MSAAAPWSVKGIDPKAREVAKDLARRSGMTLGEWLNTMIMDDGEDEEPFVPLSRRAHAAETIDRRGRSRRLDDAYDREPTYDRSDDVLHRVAASVDAIAARLEAAERRSTVAIQGVDQAVTGLVRRLDGQDTQSKAHARRIDDIAEELREGHRRLRTFEQDVGPETKKTFGKVETGLGALASRLYDIEERQRSGVNELRARMDAVEKTAGPGVGSDMLAQVGARLDTAQARTTEALKGLERSFAGLDQRLRAAEGRVEPEGAREAARFEKLAETLARQVEGNRADMMRRLDTAEHEGRMSRLESAVLAIGDTVKTSEQRSAQGIDAMGREVLRIAQNLNGRVGKVEADIAGQNDRLNAAVNQKVEGVSADLTSKMDRDMGRYAQAVEQRLTRTDDLHAIALEKLGGEITRISDRLADRIAQSERKSAQALEEIGRRLSDSSDRVEQRHERTSGELAERMRLSEERTAQLLAQARETLTERAERAPAREAARFEPDVNDLRQPDWRAAAFGDDYEAEADAKEAWSADPLGVGPEPAPFPGSIGTGAIGASLAERVLVQSAVMPEQAPALAPAPVETAATPTFASPTFASPTSMSQAFGSPEAAPAAALDRAYAPETYALDPACAPGPAAQAFGGFGGAAVEDALEATEAVRPQAFAAQPAYSDEAGFDAGPDDFSAETDFVDARSMRAGLATGAATARANSTRSAIDAARAAMVTPIAAEEAPRSGFGLKRGGKSRLQERLDKQANKDGSTIRKALLASVTGVAVIGGVFAMQRLTGAEPFAIPGMDTVSQALGLSATPSVPVADETPTLAAVALTPTDAVPVDQTEAQGLFNQAIDQIDSGQPGGVATLTRAANLGLAVAQLKLADIYQSGESGVKQNPVEARLWARRAAEGGDPRGMHNFGMYLYEGTGGAKNRPEALSWLLKAAEQGLVDSQYNVARIYENGDEGIAPNAAEALKWYMIAARTGDADAQGSVTRVTPTVPAAGRRTARAAAEAFQTEPLA